MKNSPVIALLLIVGGAALLIAGLKSSKSATSQLSELFNDRPTQETTMLLLGGIGGIGLGAWMFGQSKSKP